MSTQETIRRRAGSVEETALKIAPDNAEQLVDALNTDLAATYVLYHQSKKHHWNVEGAEFLGVHEYLGDIAEDLEESADELAERAQAIGGVPLAGGATFEEHAPIDPEGEDVYGVRTSLENDIEAFGVVIESLRDHIALAGELGDYTTEELLRDILETAEEHAHHLEHYLEDDTLVTESATN
ncbi:MAG: DNA starvation/stationary phase protection protein DpsA [Natronomonas sp.]|jgi:DNA-binding ferritin-like protein|uniref:DNA starvation/stationary phase protection protein DpsA n=1 Tax=Natronomonas sp. TaxID=2184060 RepID=UPI00286FCB0D|nr:DNA starvation/stationary phase protection protein DpsA [Natronomonas sp.]MDR9381568.1 DNA starvation/stationary phase protection protein DpsA [Natronomonas sp.]MDR9429158.1 DNA starvation/stationary phase protection protein DpsA [Natronomonas sp.]